MVKSERSRSQIIFQKEAATQVFFCEIFEIFKNPFLLQNSSVAASENLRPGTNWNVFPYTFCLWQRIPDKIFDCISDFTSMN